MKKGNTSQVINYRPVSLLNIPGKIFETLIFQKLYTFCSPFLIDSQSGFRKNRSTATQLITFLQKIYEGIATNSDIDVIFTDFSKAFDKVDQGLLLQNIYNMGIRAKLFQVIKSFVVGRRQQVGVKDSPSKQFLATSGVPQGSILSPCLFLICINDLHDLCNVVYPLLFADDAKFLCVGLDTKAIQNDLNNIFNWTISNEMPFDMEKCAHIAIPNKMPAEHRNVFRYKNVTLQPGFDPMTSCLAGRRTTNCATVTSLSFH